MSGIPRTKYQTISVDPLSPTVGAEVSGFRMDGNCSPSCIAEIRQALLDWKVIFFRDQDVSREDHIAFGRSFGELEIHPFATNHPDHPEIVVIHHDAGLDPAGTSDPGRRRRHSFCGYAGWLRGALRRHTRTDRRDDGRPFLHAGFWTKPLAG